MNDLKITQIADELEKQVLDSSIRDETIWNLLKLSKTTYYRLKPKALHLMNQRALLRQTALNDTITYETKEAAKTGLKSKTDRVLLLQKQVEDIQADLTDNKTVGYVIIGGVVQKVTKELAAREKAYMRKCMKEIQSEISRIEGDYAPNRHEHTGKDGKPIETENKLSSNVDYTKLPENVLELIVAARIKNPE